MAKKDTVHYRSHRFTLSVVLQLGTSSHSRLYSRSGVFCGQLQTVAQDILFLLY